MIQRGFSVLNPYLKRSCIKIRVDRQMASQNQEIVLPQQIAKVEAPATPKEQEGRPTVSNLSQDTQFGTWTIAENMKFVIFMEFHRNVFISKGRRKTQKIFTQLARFLKTRTPRQCRSHFQKMMIKFCTISRMRSVIRKQVGPGEFDYQSREFIQSRTLLTSVDSKNSLPNEDLPLDIATQTDFTFQWNQLPLFSTGMPIYFPNYFVPSPMSYTCLNFTPSFFQASRPL